MWPLNKSNFFYLTYFEAVFSSECDFNHVYERKRPDYVSRQEFMNEHVENGIVAFTSQSLRQYGMRAVRMDDIAKNMSVSKKTIYRLYRTKNELINSCLESYLRRVENIFRLIRTDSSDMLACLWKVSEAYIDNLYRGSGPFWRDVLRYSEYEYIYAAYNRVWSSELKNIISTCRYEKDVVPDFNIPVFLNSFTTVLYHARLVECTPAMLRNSAYYMLRGIMTARGGERFKQLVPLCEKVY